MPEISRFLGIVILMHFRDHNPPHFHVQYNEFEAAVLIETLGRMEGWLPPRVLSLAVEWAGLHQTELLENWNALRSTGRFHRIEPPYEEVAMLLKIEEASYLGEHRFRLRFNDGRVGTVDLRPLAEEEPRAVFAPLADESLARDFRLKHGTLCWPRELDVAPEYLYFLAFREDPALHDRFAAWGYLGETARA